MVDWISVWGHHPDVVHVHDHHTALIPFIFRYCYKYQHLSNIPTVLTIHNAQYQGWLGWDKSYYLPPWDPWKWGMLEWNNSINPLASGIKCAWKVTTVSWSYLDELKHSANGLESLFEYEKGKCVGILNGIDTSVWDPSNDKYIENHFTSKTADEGKKTNKQILCDTFCLDVLPMAISDSYYYIGRKMCFLILGSGFPEVEEQLERLKQLSQNDYNVYIGYNESLSHLMYSGADFLLMPSRVEPCGLNQMYSMRYGTVPMVRRTGGLKDRWIWNRLQLGLSRRYDTWSLASG